LGGRVAEVAEQLDMPLMPWQRHVVDVALEVDPDTGRLAYREIGLTVPRQSGKTSLILATAVHRALGFGHRQNITYAAQTRNDARVKWEDEHVVTLETSPFKKLFRVRKTNGNEAILWRNGSRHGITANTEKSGHGPTLDLGFLDEAFSQVDNRMEQAFKPAMVTRPNAQMWVVSTAGTDTSVYLKTKIARGRQRVEDGHRSGVAYFEWSAPDDADPTDEDVWWSCMPAVGHTIDREAIRADFASMDLVEFQRAYLNQWPDRNPKDRVIPVATWAALADPRSRPDASALVFAVDTPPDRGSAAIASAGRRSDGRMHVKVVDFNAGTGWVADRLAELNERYQPVAVMIDPAGPAGALLSDLAERGFEVHKGDTSPPRGALVPISGQKMGQACGAFYDDAVNDRMRHCSQDVLDTALDDGCRRYIGDGAWAWDRRKSTGNIAPLVAVTLAAHGFRVHGARPAVEPWAAWV
jgi:phage terminase large subunit-like protein